MSDHPALDQRHAATLMAGLAKHVFECPWTAPAQGVGDGG